MLDLKEASIEIREIINNRQKELKLTLHALKKTLYVYKKALKLGIKKYLVGETIKPVFRRYN